MAVTSYHDPELASSAPESDIYKKQYAKRFRKKIYKIHVLSFYLISNGKPSPK
jgi:hypothetical protein